MRKRESPIQVIGRERSEGQKRYCVLFGRRVKELRIKAGILQSDMADDCGIYRTYLSRIEGGRANPTLLVIIAIARCLQVSLSELVDEEDYWKA